MRTICVFLALIALAASCDRAVVAPQEEQFVLPTDWEYRRGVAVEIPLPKSVLTIYEDRYGQVDFEDCPVIDGRLHCKPYKVAVRVPWGNRSVYDWLTFREAVTLPWVNSTRVADTTYARNGMVVNARRFENGDEFLLVAEDSASSATIIWVMGEVPWWGEAKKGVRPLR